MNRNTETYFNNLPTVDIQRSKFERPSDHKTTMNTGDLVPIYVDEVLPGDTIEMNMASLIRMSTPIYPIMDNANVDFYFFFCPSRLVWQHFREFWGENRQTAWEQTTEYEIPQIKAPSGGWKKGTIADYMGIPTKIENISVNHLPFRAYCQIWNDWFRDENLKDTAMVSLDETTLNGTNSGDYVANAQLGAKPLKVAKYADYYTTCQPNPQKGPSVSIPLGGIAPVIGTEPYYTAGNTNTDLLNKNISMYRNSTGQNSLVNENSSGGQNQTYIGLGVDLNETIGGFSIQQLRTSFAIQRYYEKLAIGGSRYIEFLKNIFGVTSPDARQQRTEYLGGKRVPINIDQVLQTSATDTTSPQGNTAAFSCTADSDHMFTHSFTEHGYLIGLACIRTEHTYQQGIERMWSRKKWSDFYIPQFANLGAMPVKNKEIYATGTDADEETFGFQEAWADYRFKNSRVSGAMRSNYDQSLDAWHYADDYSSQPTLSSEWIDEVESNVDRTIAVSSELEDQFICDYYFKATYVRPLPMYSVPGLIDHH